MLNSVFDKDEDGVAVTKGVPSLRPRDAATLILVRRDLAFAIANGKPVVPVLLAETPSEGFGRVLEQHNRIDARGGVLGVHRVRLGDRAVDRRRLA